MIQIDKTIKDKIRDDIDYGVWNKHIDKQPKLVNQYFDNLNAYPVLFPNTRRSIHEQIFRDITQLR